MPERGWLGGTPRPAAHFLLSGSLARSISDDWARTYIQNLGEIALVFRADELGPSGGQELGVQVVLKPVAAEGIAVVDFDEQRAAVAGHAEIGGVAGRRIPTGIDAVAWAEEAARRGAGEILLTIMDRDGIKDGFDIPLTRSVARAVDIPVIASGGVGTLEHFAEGIIDGEADAVLAASVFHFGTYSIRQVKEYMASQGIPVRLDF